MLPSMHGMLSAMVVMAAFAAVAGTGGYTAVWLYRTGPGRAEAPGEPQAPDKPQASDEPQAAEGRGGPGVPEEAEGPGGPEMPGGPAGAAGSPGARLHAPGEPHLPGR
jgi:hypothetical protein